MNPEILFEDNHLLIINKKAGELAQGDETGDIPLIDSLKDYIKQRDNKPGNVFLGLVHRLDRPTSGVLIFAKTSKENGSFLLLIHCNIGKVLPTESNLPYFSFSCRTFPAYSFFISLDNAL